MTTAVTRPHLFHCRYLPAYKYLIDVLGKRCQFLIVRIGILSYLI